MPNPEQPVNSSNAAPPAGFGLFIRTWQNGNLIDEHLVCRAKTFEDEPTKILVDFIG